MEGECGDVLLGADLARQKDRGVGRGGALDRGERRLPARRSARKGFLELDARQADPRAFGLRAAKPAFRGGREQLRDTGGRDGTPEEVVGAGGDSLVQVALVDEGDRAYPSGQVMLPLGPFGCSPDDYESPSPFTTTFYFLLPAQARPQALQITWLPLLPRYVQLPVDG